MRRTFLSIFCALLLMTLLTSTTFAAPAAKQLPFKGTLQAVEVGNTVDFPPVVHVTATGSGNATLLGGFTDSYTVDIYVNFDNRTATGTTYYTFVAANGDKLYSVGQGVGGMEPVTNYVTETHVITGGTGRYAGATGNFVIFRSITAGVTSGTFDGYIILANGN